MSTPSFVNGQLLSITSGGTWQLLFAANANRLSLLVENYSTATAQNIATAESLFVAFDSAPVGNSLTGTIELTAGGSFYQGVNCTEQAVYVYAATAGHAFYGAQQ